MGLVSDIYLSVLRWLVGFLAGTALGLVFALVLYFFPRPRSVFQQILNYLRAIPILALVPVVQLHLGINVWGNFILVGWAVCFPVWLSVFTILQREQAESIAFLTASKVSKAAFLRLYLLPKIIGGVYRGGEIGIGIGWIALLAAESIGTYSQGFWSGGLGFRLLTSYQQRDFSTMYVCIILFGVLGLISAFLWQLLGKFLVSRGFDPITWMNRV
jgi:ABC-type nitrate/sulfonate/bicarbonate transport system permease component